MSRYPQPTDARGRVAAPRASAVTESVHSGSRRTEIVDLIERVRAAGGAFRVEDPEPAVRAAYRRAISAAITSGEVPEGYRLRHTGRDRGDLTIRLVRTDDLPRPRQRLPAVPIPDTLEHLHDVVGELAQHDRLFAVSAEQRPRALRIIQGVADEAARRGYGFSARPNAEPGFRMIIGEDSYDLTISEEHEKVETYPDDEVAAKRYPWQRVSARPTTVPSGRLVLELADGYRPSRWAVGMTA